jgi:hypothetical protein
MRRTFQELALGAGVVVFLVLACGSRSELPPGVVVTAAGSSSVAGSAAVECVVADDCPPPPPEQCGAAACLDGKCLPSRGVVCDDGDPCTADSCQAGSCVFADARVDGDGDGAFASGNESDPLAAFGCGQDCDDAAANVRPGAAELCDGVDNDCNGVVDDGTQLEASGVTPRRVSPPDADRAWASGLAFDGETFGATITSTVKTRTQGQFQQLSSRGELLGAPRRIARVNAGAFGGPLVWTGERYLTAYHDARQDGNYEIYFNPLNRQGERLSDDLRVTAADDYSLRPSVLWTGAEALLIWDDRRFEGSGDASVIFGQRVTFEGDLVGGNLRLTPAGVRAESASAALSSSGVGIAFSALDAANQARLKFMTTSRLLTQASAPVDIPFDDPNEPVVTALDDVYVVTFHQETNVVGAAIYGAVLGKDGSLIRAPQSMTAGAAHARTNATYSYGDRFLMVWADDRDGTYQLSAQTFDKKLSPISPRIRVTTTMTNAFGPLLAPAADGGVGVLFTDDGNGLQQAFFTRLDCRARDLGLK